MGGFPLTTNESTIGRFERRLETKSAPHEVMSNEETAQAPAALEFEPDPSSKKKKGVHKPVYSPVFIQKSIQNTDIGRIHLLVNPFSGKKKGQKIGENAKQILETEGHSVEIHFSAHSGHLIEIAESIQADPNDIFAVVGGDGSLSEVITGRMKATSERSERFALIPAGTGNSVANDLRLTSTEQAVRGILKGTWQNLDLARVEMVEGLPGSEKSRTVRYSHNLVTWGLGVDSTIKAERMRWMGPIRYDVGILMAIMANNRRHATLTLDGKTMEDDYTLFLIQNSQTGGSMLPLAPGASLDDGMMDIGILKKMTRRDVLKAFGMLKSEGRHVFHPRVDYHKFKTLRIDTPAPAAINVDGENIGSTPLQMEVLSNAVQICVPN